MKTAAVNISAIFKHPVMRMDAAYHIGKAAGKKAYKKVAKGLLEEDDVAGTIMLKPEAAEKYNKLKTELMAHEEDINNQLKHLLK